MDIQRFHFRLYWFSETLNKRQKRNKKTTIIHRLLLYLSDSHEVLIACGRGIVGLRAI